VKLKLDENLGKRGMDLLVADGHDVCTVAIQSLTSATDEELAKRCFSEGRALVTLDLDFSNPFRFPPESSAGIAVLRGPARLTSEDLELLMQTLVIALRTHALVGKLWIVEKGRVRVFQRPIADSDQEGEIFSLQ
jgi:predicted nuclease of predicted toxin-antitoxin system